MNYRVSWIKQIHDLRAAQMYTFAVAACELHMKKEEKIFGEDPRMMEGGTKSVHNTPSSAGLAASR